MATQGAAKEQTKSRIREPKRYRVIMHNDDFTTMEFVVDILVRIFHKNEIEAEQIMMSVHQKGSAVVGVYPYDIAKTRILESMNRAKAEGFPFRMTMEEA
ncbi:ATP-dependent Clp protease adaptor ClpS [Eubacterium oxidoreducens]|uniref:ATP-dependent Clp protease adapter protein ClpS n=1 Tax=Eubacterium oxidoreducens TaxID=1732 RepID=A0A1G6AUP3_EUBOX|nr:ATP-dependent Clp protease adaptor ClpS [Eubacterium oxidoreducens]SDB12019.1 ATP-dependent Clp protease adaptor protein ClpS [Eubacterium oxidoreducens]